MSKIGVIGHFAFGKKMLDGQTVKTKTLTDALKKQLGDGNVCCVDTYGGLKKLFKIVFSVPSLLKTSSDVIMLPARNGLLVITPVMCLFNKLNKRQLHYVVIGGWLPEYLDKHKITAKLLRKNFKGIYVETGGMQEKLQQRMFNNIIVMPNCKQLNIVDEAVFDYGEPYKFCTFSRVMREKGIEDAINAVTQINHEAGKILCTLDIFGQIDSTYTETFEKMQESFPEYISYKGLVEFSKSTDVLKEYYALLFPTYYDGEGFAGTVIDAFAAGIPVIASDWRYNAEIVEHMKTGLIYPQRSPEALKKSMLLLIKESELNTKLRENCIIAAKRYLPQIVVDILLKNFTD